MFQLRGGIFRSYVLCEMKISYEIMKECVDVSVYDVVSRRLVVEAGHREVL